jgi:hypothetical protein
MGVYTNRKSTTQARFKTTTEPRGDWAFGCAVATYHGVREEALAKRQEYPQMNTDLIII